MKPIPDNEAAFNEYREKGEQAYQEGKYQTAMLFFEQALEFRPDDKELRQTYAKVLKEIGEVKSSERIYLKLIAELEADNISDRLNLVPLYRQLGFIAREKQDYDNALQWHEKVRKIQEEETPLNYSDLVHTYNTIGMACIDKGEFDTGIQWYEKAKKMLMEALPEALFALAGTYNGLAIAYSKKGDFYKAIEFQEAFLRIELGIDENSILKQFHAKLIKGYLKKMPPDKAEEIRTRVNTLLAPFEI